MRERNVGATRHESSIAGHVRRVAVPMISRKSSPVADLRIQIPILRNPVRLRLRTGAGRGGMCLANNAALAALARRGLLFSPRKEEV
jgi:hypothetical protein